MDNKELYHQKIEAQLALWKAEIEVIKAKAKLQGTDIRRELQEEANYLEAKLAEAKIKIDELAESSEEAWGELKDGAESIWDTLKKSLNEAKSKFN